MAEETAIGKPLEVYVSKTEAELLSGEPNVLGLSSDQDTIVFNDKVIGSGAGVRYKKITLSASSGWIRFAQHKIAATTNVTAIFGIERGYGSGVDEHYMFASTLNHQKRGYITQLVGGYAADTRHFIKKVRTAQSSSDTKPFYLDFYIESSSVESYYVWILGNWELLDISRVDEAADTTSNITRFVEFETTNGFATSGDVNVAQNLTAQGDVKANNFIGNLPDTLLYPKELTVLQCLKSPRLRSLNSQIRNNLLSFNGSALTAEYTIDGGTTWVDFGLSDTRKQQFVTDGWEFTTKLNAGNGVTTVTPQLKGVRLTYDFSAIANGTFYGNISDAIITMRAIDKTVMKVEVLDWKNNVWAEKGTYNPYSPDALPNAVYLGTLIFRKASTTTADQYKAIRFTFSYQGTETALTSIPFNIYSLKLFSNGLYSIALPNYARYGHLYSADIEQNMILPNGLLPSTTNDKNLGSASKVFNLVYANRLVGVADKADKLTNARTIDTSGAVESTATPFDGSENISIQMDSVKESYLTLGGKNLVGNVSPIDMAISSYLNANRFAYLKAEYILIEYSTDGGQTWFTQRTDTDAIKTLLFTDISYSRIYLGGTSETGINKSNYQTRITITDTSANAASLYASLKKFIIRVAGAGAGTGFACTIQGRTNANVTANIDEWVTFADKSKLQGDSGYNVINTDYIVTYGNESRHYQQLRFLFTATTTSTSTKPCVLSIHAFAYNAWITPSTMASTGRLYSVDSLQNMIIPNHLLPDTTLTNNLGAANKSFQNVFTRFIDTPTSYNLQLKASGTSRWQVSSSSGNFLPVTDSNLNIGSESLKVKEIYANRLVGVADKATADKNNKDLTTYVSGITKTARGIQITKGNGTTSDVDISSNILRFQGVLDVEPTYASSGVSSWNYITFVKPLNKFVAVNSSALPPTYHQAFNNGEISQDTYNNNPNVLFIDNIAGETYTWHGDTNETFSKISGTKEYTTEVISIDANFNVTCLSNNAIKTLPTDILNGVMYLKSNGAVKSTAIPLNLGTTPNYPIKYLNGTTWVDATILVRVSSIAAQWFLTVPSDTPVSTEGLVLEGQITANFA